MRMNHPVVEESNQSSSSNNTNDTYRHHCDSNDKKHVEDYETCIRELFSSVHIAKTPDAIQYANSRRVHTVEDMRGYMREIFDNDASSSGRCHFPFPIVHITGTKGKGSTACFCESILRNCYGYNTGLFTSPHLVDIRERIRINGRPVSKQIFANAYWTIRKKLDKKPSSQQPPPGYFRMLTLMALYIFHHYSNPRLNAIILEVGVGGRYDATNVLDMMCVKNRDNNMEHDSRNNVVCGVTLLDLDHTDILGSTIEEIAWQKGGIFKVFKESDNNHHDKKYNNQALQLSESEQLKEAEETKTKKTMQHSKEQGQKYQQKKQTRRFFTISSNPQSALSVLQECAVQDGMGGELVVVDVSTNNEEQEDTKDGGNHHQTLDSNKDNGDNNKSKFTRVQIVLPDDCNLGLKGNHQIMNAKLALALCQELVKQNTINEYDHIKSSGVGNNNSKNHEALLHHALENASWPGRCQTIPLQLGSHAMQNPDDFSTAETREKIANKDARDTTNTTSNTDSECNRNINNSVIVNLRLDGAHTPKSVQVGFDWFQSVSNGSNHNDTNSMINNNPKKRVLIFNCSHDRNPVDLLQTHHTLIFDEVYFCRPDSERPSTTANKKSAIELLRESGISMIQDTEEENLTNEMKSNVKLDKTKLQANSKAEGNSTTWQETLSCIWKYLEKTKETSPPSSPKLKTTTVVIPNLTARQALEHCFGCPLDAFYQVDKNMTETGEANNNNSCLQQQQQQQQQQQPKQCIEIFVTGSLYMVGSVLNAIKWSEVDADGDLQQ